jgi:polar amino acid transport system substrate-binding protein
MVLVSIGRAAVVLAWAALSLAGAPLKLEMAVEEYPPLMGEKLPYGGILTRIVTEAYARAGVSVQLRWVPNNRAITGVMDGAYEGTYGWTHSPERDRKLLFSNSVIYNFRMTFFQRRGEDYAWKKLEDLAPYRIGITIGNHYSDEFSALQAAGRLNVDPAPADPLNMKKLASGRIDLFPMEQESGQMLADLTLSREDRDRITYQGSAIWEVPVYVVITRSSPRARDLVARFDRGYGDLAASGRLKALVEEARQKIREQVVRTP